jgi:hypothetical protein
MLTSDSFERQRNPSLLMLGKDEMLLRGLGFHPIASAVLVHKDHERP